MNRIESSGLYGRLSEFSQVDVIELRDAMDDPILDVNRDKIMVRRNER